MVAGGIPQERPDSARAVAEMELDMQHALVSFHRLDRTNLRIRIGMNTGAVVARVIGTKKFIGDLWGDSVNTASQIESHGIANLAVAIAIRTVVKVGFGGQRAHGGKDFGRITQLTGVVFTRMATAIKFRSRKLAIGS